MARKTLTAAARQRLTAIADRYKPQAANGQAATSVTDATGLELAAVSLCREELERARIAFDAGDWKQSQRLYADIRSVASQVPPGASNAREAKSVATSALLGQIGSLLNLQEVARAGDLVQDVDESSLDTRQRTVLARALVELNFADRARAVLDGVLPHDRGDERWREASALVDLARGNVPEVFDRVPSVLFSLARLRLQSGEVAQAASLAFEALEKGPKNSILEASLVSTAMIALMRTVFEDDIADAGIPVEQRLECSRKIAAEFKAALSADPPAPVRANLIEVALNYAGSLRERELFRWTVAHSDASERERGQPNEVRLAFEFAEKGDLTKALELMPRPVHPWRSELMRAQLLRVAGDQDSSLDALNGLISVWPGRVPIHIALTELLIERRQFDRAVVHAEAAYRALPTDSMATLLARCLVELGDGARALDVLTDVETTEHVVELRAYAADLTSDSRAVTYWAQFLSYDSGDVNAKLRLATALIRAGDVEGAARHARELLDGSGASLGRDQLAACGQMLTMARFLPSSDALIQRAAELLRTRFPDDDKAEMYRLTLLASLGFPADATPIDYERLTRAGHVRALSIDDAAELIRDRAALVKSAHHLYQEGWLDAETLCQVTGTRIASLVVGWAKVAASGRTPLRAAIYPGLTGETQQVRGRRFLCSGLELALLQKCGALACVPAAIGDGALVALESTWGKLLDDAYYLEQSVQREEQARLAKLLAKIASAPRVRRTPQSASDRELAQQQGATFVAAVPTVDTDAHARSLLEALATVGALSRPQVEHAERFVSSEVKETKSVDLNRPLLFENGLLELLDAADVLDPVLATASEVIITDDSVANIKRRLDELEADGEAANLQHQLIEALGAGLRAGWFQLAREPVVASFPTLRADVDQDQATLLTRSIKRQASLKELINQNGAWLRVAADSFGFDSVGHPQQWRMLAFKDEREGMAFVRRYWRPGVHEITLSGFVRSVVPEAQRAPVMRVLAQLGFADALLPEDVVSLVRDYGRVDVGTAARILDGMESGADDSHSRGVFARMQLSVVYAMAAWRLAKERAPQAALVLPQLLSRLDELDKRHAHRLVEQTVSTIILAALDDREASFVEEKPGTYSLLRSSIAGQLWQHLADWRGTDVRRQASFRRAVAHAWEQLDKLKGGPKNVAQWAPLALATDVLVENAAYDARIPNPDAVVGVLSALWTERPLVRKNLEFTSSRGKIEVDLESLLAHAASEATKEEWVSRCEDGTSLKFAFSPTGSEDAAEVSVPIEAVMLRTEPEAAARMARGLAIRDGTRDGRLYRALIEFSKNPSDIARRKFVAGAACSSPFRLVADDPRFIYSFGDRAAISQHGYPATLEELRELLSEPNDLLEADARTLAKRFFDRFDEGGAWFDREDKVELAELASRVPGPLPSAAARAIFQQQSSSDLQQIERALTVSQNMPIGMLSMAAAFGMLVLCNGSDLDQSRSMADAFVAMLRTETSGNSEKQTVAAVEPATLNSIGQVVSRFLPWGASRSEHAWLTTRLYEWWMSDVRVADLLGLVSSNADETWQRLRGEVVLNVMLDILEATVVTQGHVPLLPDALLATLQNVASREAANPFEPAKRPSWIYWERPQGCEWLASSLLLWCLPDAFFDLRPELRLAMLEKLPRTNEVTREHAISFQPVFRALSRAADRLTDPELSTLREWLEGAETGPLLDLWRADLLTGFFGARGDASAAAKLRELAATDRVAAARSELVAGYIEAATSARAGGMESTVADLLAIVLKTEDGAERIRAGLELAFARPARERVVELLNQLLQRPEVAAELRNSLEQALRSASR